MTRTRAEKSRMKKIFLIAQPMGKVLWTECSDAVVAEARGVVRRIVVKGFRFARLLAQSREQVGDTRRSGILGRPVQYEQ